MIVAGHETSAHVLGFALGYLALHPEEQDKIWQEIEDVCGGSAPSESHTSPCSLSTPLHS
jgi:cytochrome P450